MAQTVHNFKILGSLGKASKDGCESYTIGSANGKKYVLQIWRKTNFGRMTNMATNTVFHEGPLEDFHWEAA